MGKEIISVVVPIYNVENYLEKCIKSIQKQTYHNIEIILVDDGSTDMSGKICDEFKKVDFRVKVIHQKNSGLTVARRNGVSLATGKYVGFVDGDDWIEPDMYEYMLNKAISDNSDIVTIAGVREYENYKTILQDGIKNGRYVVDDDNMYILKHLYSGVFSGQEYLNGAVWSKLFKKDIIKNVLNNMNDNIMGYMDDNVCVVGCVTKSNVITCTNRILYHHRERTSAFSHSKNKMGLTQVNNGYLGMMEIIKNSKYADILYPQLREQVITNAFHAIFNMFDEKIEFPQFFFRTSKIKYADNVIIYGGGNVGKSYLLQFNIENKYNVVGIIDKYKKIESNEINIKDLINYDYDYIIIAIYDQNLSNEIKYELIKNNIPENKIVWERPISIFEYYMKI